MKQKKLKTDFIIPKSLALIFLIITSLFYLKGCTIKALKLAKEKASPENCEYWKIKTVVSAVKQKNGDISICVELNTPNGNEELKLNTITLPLATLTGEKTAVEMLELRPAECPFAIEQIHRSEECWFDDEGWLPCPGDEYTDATCFWYPIEKSKSGCETVSPGSLSSTSVVPIERLEVHNKDRNQLYDLLDSYK